MKIGRKDASSKIGAMSEILAAAWLMKRDYSVFHNLSPIGKIDLIAEREGVLIKIDVKTAPMSSVGKISLSSAKNEHLGIQYLYVLPGGECMWKQDVIDKDMNQKRPAEAWNKGKSRKK